ncbi:hypothetical protein L4X63_11375 [Geomonas sp. Red32]|uniref:hypothetical protein n=1 Tax=Geomonas sp. Red32 TaxID=2912856 RepID=UPI00202CBF5B|nr:hypothetical protein [Geomonas sp. Red32]MCM0082192.1 hypothetical protein [Geomonas sp. Red32]
MKKESPHKDWTQAGYLLEVPILLCLVGVSLALVVPHLSSTGRKIAVTMASVPVLFALYYMIVVPGWMGGNKVPAGPVTRWAIFALAAAAVAAAVVMIDFR